MEDPFGVLGVPLDASLPQIRAARRRLAVTAHPDRGGSEEEMKVVNAAFEAAVAHATGRRLSTGRSATPAGRDSDPAARPNPSRATSRIVRQRGGRRSVEHDSPSFTVDALPVEAFEALLIATSWIGEVLVDEPPYLLEVHLYEPDHCWCRLELVPDAGGSTVSLTVASIGGTPTPDVEVIRDLWVAQLNQLGRWNSG